ncbi:hypothetical protein GCM10009823_30830 [Brevibacterium salitolerans]|uniref:Uncharacterized protein n=2 Tax=Brevibacterium salitolerans TaxID=1403566 RepID=A0ABN2X510_9MICO
MRETAPYILRKTTDGSMPFNGPCVRMLGDLREDGSHITPFQPAGFFDHLCSNELMRWEIAPDGQSWGVRREYLYDGD